MRSSLNFSLTETSLTEVKQVDQKIPDGEMSDSGIEKNSINSLTAPCSADPSPRNSTGMIPVGQLTASVVASNTVSVIRKPPENAPGRVPTPFGSVSSVPEMSKEERTRILRRNLTHMFSCIYAVLLSIMGAVISVSNHSPENRHINEVFLCTIAAIGLAWLIFFHIDLFRYKQSALKMMIKSDDQSDGVSTCTDYNISVSWNSIDSTPYRFLQGRHSGSFYLKAGLAAFCFGHLINEGLQLGQEILNYVQEDRYSMNCGSIASVLLHVIRPIYSFYQLFIVFKYSNIIINKYKEVARFSLMHLLATCLCFWFSTIVEDALEDYHHHLTDEANKKKLSNISHHSYSASMAECLAHNSNSSRCYCASHAILSVNNLQAIPYLYPFTVEFNLLLAGVWFIVWHNIGKDHSHSNPHHFHHKINTNDGVEEVTYQSNLVISADCHASNKGLFAGLFLLMASIISVIVFFVAMSSKQYFNIGVSIHTSQEAILTFLSLIGCLLAYCQISRLDFNLHPITFLDDVLLFIPLPFYFAHGFLSIMAESQKGDAVRIFLSAAMVIQVIIQTPFIIDGLRRCSNTHKLRYKKPGRELVTFLIVCNLTMWIVNTFEVKSVENHYGQSEYFGELVWMFIGHTTLPLMLFYRFHSSVCLADMWKSAYDKGE